MTEVGNENLSIYIGIYIGSYHRGKQEPRIALIVRGSVAKTTAI